MPADLAPPPRRISVKLYPYQRRWIEDHSPYKIACKARQIGFTFAATYRVVHQRLRRPGLSVWLSASERQALEAMQHLRQHLQAMNAVASYTTTPLEGFTATQHRIELPNGSRIIALPSNPDTVRGFAGDIVLDEFAFHRDADAIWRAAFAIATRGFQLEIISTPNGARGRYYELARNAGLVDFTPPLDVEEPGGTFLKKGFPRTPSKDFLCDAARPLQGAATSREKVLGERENTFLKGFSQSPSTPGEVWSAHWIDLSLARTLGFAVDVESLRAAIGDEESWQQEYCCRFLSQSAHYLPPELVVAAEHPAATTSPPLDVPGIPLAHYTPSGRGAEPVPSCAEGHPPRTVPLNLSNQLFLGVDIGRHRDLTVLWLLEIENPVAPPDARTYLTRGVITLNRQPFSQQRSTLDALLTHRLTAREEFCGETFLKKGSPRTPSKDFPGDAARPLQGAATSRQKVLGERENAFPKGFSQSVPYAVRRCAVDASGMGAMLAEELQQKWGSRVEPVVFTAAVKEEMAVRVKRLLEDGRLKIPADPAIRAALNSVKREVTQAGNLRFDAERTAQGGHADHFWALALALHTATEANLSTDFVSTATRKAHAGSAAY
jgi:phage FluMu gp28-like protein